MFDPSQLLEILFNNADKITFFLLQTKINDPLFFMERPIFANFAVVKSSARDMIVHRAICIIHYNTFNKYRQTPNCLCTGTGKIVVLCVN